MTQPLLQTPERAAIEALLATSGEGAELLTFEYLHGYLTGVVLTPGGLLPSEWVSPLLDINHVVFPDLATGKRFFDRVIELHNRINEARLSHADLCPYEVSSQQLLDDDVRDEITEWVCGLHAAIGLRSAVWLVDENEAPTSTRRFAKR
jgi:yecA family protein